LYRFLPIRDFVQTIRIKLLGSILLVLVVAIGTALYGIWTYERDQFVDIAHQDAMRAGRTIEKALRSSMLQNDRKLMELAMNDIGTIIESPSRVSIVANGGTVGFSTDRELVGTVIDRDRDVSCTVCHVDRQTVPNLKAVMLENAKDGPFLRNVIKIVNEPACYACHPASQKNLGILLFDSFLYRTYDLLETVAFRTMLTGLVTFLVIVLVLCYVVNRFIHQPIAALQQGFTQVGRGNYGYWINLPGGGEFAEMADSFNIMTKAIERFINEIKLKNKETATLYTAVQQISKTIDWVELKKILIDLLADIFETEQICLVLPDWTQDDCFEVTWRPENANRLRFARHCPGLPDFHCPALSSEELDGWVHQYFNKPLFLEQQNRVLIPLLHNEKSLGFVVVRKNPDNVFGHSEKAFIPPLAIHLAIATENARLYHMAITDALTGLFARRYFLEAVNRLDISTAESDIGQFGLLMLDLDHFKEVNDSYGHPAGDQVLVQVAGLLKDKIRHGDIACRYGGEEFAILLPDLSEGTEIVAEIAERLCRTIGQHIFICAGTPPIHLTVSIGAAIFPRDGASVDELIKAADSSLYEAKRGGRNRVHLYQ
jgi:diguanylate cyclase (GGDEF)-like protein